MKGAMVYELEKDMLTIKGKPKIVTSNTENVFEENRFFEASSIRKINRKCCFYLFSTSEYSFIMLCDE